MRFYPAVPRWVLLGAEGDDWVYGGGAAGGDEAGDEGGGRQDDGDGEESGDVPRADAEEDGLHCGGGADGAGDAEEDADAGETPGFA